MIASPCIDVCRMDETTGLCQGCYRSIAEISAWSNADDLQKTRILTAISQRRQRIVLSADSPSRCPE